MKISDILDPERVMCGVGVGSKKRGLELLSRMIVSGQPSLNETEVFDSLVARERLGSTGVGQGVALPHGRMKNCTAVIGAFIQLKEGIDFDAIDGQPVDLLFALVVPEEATEEHLQTLAKLAEMFNSQELRQQLHTADSSAGLFDLLTQWESRH